MQILNSKLRALNNCILTQIYANLTQINADCLERYLRPSACNLRESAFKKVFFNSLYFGFLIFILLICVFGLLVNTSFSQDTDLEFTLDVTSNTIPLPKIFKPSIDLSGRGFHRQANWPQELAAPEVLDIWQKDIGFSSVYRMQYNLWEINQSARDKEAQEKLLNNYENIIKRISDAGGIVILDIFGTPAGLGKVLDKKVSPYNLKEFKELIKSHIKNLSCNKRYNIWYEVWSAPDLDDFFLGRKQEYLNLYRVVAESVRELSAETKVHIPIGGPAASWWFQNFDSNTIITPEKSLTYELIKFCNHYRLPLDFITWHAYSTDPKTEQDTTLYKKPSIALIRDWLSYFRFDRNIPLIVDEWNYDSGANVLPARQERSFISASFIPSRIYNMHKAGIDYQVYFCLEDFQSNKEGVVRNVGVFSFDSEASEYKGAPKSIYNLFRMLSGLGNNMFVQPAQLNDEFAGFIATRAQAQDRVAILIYNYIDPQIAISYLSRNITSLNGAERKLLLKLITSEKLEKIMLGQLDISAMRLTNKLKKLLQKTKELNDKATKYKSYARKINIGIKNLKENYLYRRYVIDSACSIDCAFIPVEEKEVEDAATHQETLTLNPYSVNLIILEKKPPEPESAPPATKESEQAPSSTISQANTETQSSAAPAE